MSQDVRCIQTQPCKWNERHTASIYWWNEALCGYQHIRMQTTSKFMYPFTLCCFTVRWLSALRLVAYLWKISAHHPAPLPSCSIYSAQVPEVWTTLRPDSARCPSPAQTDGTASMEGVYIKRFPLKPLSDFSSYLSFTNLFQKCHKLDAAGLNHQTKL